MAKEDKSNNDPVLNPSSVVESEDDKKRSKALADAEKEAKAQAEANALQEAAVAGKSAYKVATGKALTTKRGVISGDDSEREGGGRISAADFHLGNEDFNRHVDNGFIVKA